jgi:hypothetical protein
MGFQDGNLFVLSFAELVELLQYTASNIGGLGDESSTKQQRDCFIKAIRKSRLHGEQDLFEEVRANTSPKLSCASGLRVIPLGERD